MEMNRSIMSIKEIPDWLIRKRKGEEMVGEVLIKERGWKTIIVIDVLRLLHSLVGRKCMIS